MLTKMRRTVTAAIRKTKWKSEKLSKKRKKVLRRGTRTAEHIKRGGKRKDISEKTGPK